MFPLEFYLARRRRNVLGTGICLLVISAIFLVGILCGCAARQKNVTNLPPGVTLSQVQKWDAAVADLDKIASTTSVLRQAIQALNTATVTDSTGTHKIIPDGAVYGQMLTALGKVDQSQIAAATFLKSYPQTWDGTLQAKLSAYMNDISGALNSLNQAQLLGIKNAGAQAQVQQLIAGVVNAVSRVTQLFSA
jgi:hypothetical protein